MAVVDLCATVRRRCLITIEVVPSACTYTSLLRDILCGFFDCNWPPNWRLALVDRYWSPVAKRRLCDGGCISQTPSTCRDDDVSLSWLILCLPVLATSVILNR